jgi:uncharacterized RDD family membrane protein YckC/Tfp pilus assembly major pilin PilA
MPEIQWFYLDASGVQRGPVPTESIQQSIAVGRLRADSRVWREGFADWRAIADVRELDLPANHASLPPPAPAVVPPPLPAPHATGTAVVYAGFWRRYLALFLDQIILAVPVLLLVVAIAVAIHADADNKAEAAIGPLFYLLMWVASALYYALQESSVHQATFGKRALGIKVTDLRGGRISFGNALGRWFATALSYLTCYIGFFMAGFTERKQALHDMVADTLVVDRWAYTPHPERQKHGLSGCLVAVLVGLLLVLPVTAILAAIAIPQYDQYLVRAKVAGAIASAAPAKLAIAETLSGQAQRGEATHCPSNEEAGLQPAGRYADASIRTLVTGTLQNDHCGIEITLGTNKADLQGKRIWIELDDATNGQWSCTSELPDKFLPINCRG